jgi:hypothetical protein
MYFYFVRPKIPPYELEKNLVKLVREPLKNVCGEDFASATAPALLYYNFVKKAQLTCSE